MGGQLQGTAASNAVHGHSDTRQRLQSAVWLPPDEVCCILHGDGWCFASGRLSVAWQGRSWQCQ